MLFAVDYSIYSQWRCNSWFNFAAHAYLYNKLGILHCDISLNKILLHRIGDILTTGLPINFNYSELINFEDTATLATGTYAQSFFVGNADSDTTSDDGVISCKHSANSGIQTVSTGSLIIYC